MSSQTASVFTGGHRPVVGLPNLGHLGGLGEQIFTYLYGCALEKQRGIQLRVPVWNGTSLFESRHNLCTHQLPVKWVSGSAALETLGEEFWEDVDLDGHLLVPTRELGISLEDLSEALPFSQYLEPLLSDLHEAVLSRGRSLVVVYLHHDESTDADCYLRQIATIRRWLAQRLCDFEQPVFYLAGRVTDAAYRALASFRPLIRKDLTDRLQPTDEQLDYYLMAHAAHVIAMPAALPLAARVRHAGDITRVERDTLATRQAWDEHPKDWFTPAQSIGVEMKSAVAEFNRRDFISAGSRLHRLLRTDCANIDVLSSMASLKFSDGEYVQAEYWFGRALEVEPENEEFVATAQMARTRLGALREDRGFARKRRSYSLNGLDEKLLKHMNFKGGFFIEAGGNDGLAQSNTLFFERYLGWRGLLIEPIPPLANLCLQNRPGALVENCALVPFGFEGETVEMRYCNLMSVVRGAMKTEEEENAHIKAGEDCQQLDSFNLDAPARTLNSVLERFNIGEIDLFSLDVEGFELQVLQGIDLEKYQPRYMLIEARYRDEIDRFLSPLYEPIEELSFHDVLYRLV